MICLVTVLSLAATGQGEWQGDYMIALPKALRSTALSMIVVQFDKRNISLRIDSTNPQTNEKIAGPVSFFQNGSGIVKYRVPFDNLRGRTATVRLNLVARLCKGLSDKQCFKSPKGLIFNKMVTLPVLKDPLLIFAESNKPIYKPGEVVRFRILPLLADSLLPSQPVNGERRPLVFDLIYLRAPNQMRMAQWRNVSWESALKGDQLTFQLSADPLFGKWEIVSQIGDVTDKETFIVEKYVLPKFTVSVKPPPYVYVKDTTVKFSVCAKYTTGRSMKAWVKAELCWFRKSSYTGRSKKKPRPCLTAAKALDGSKKCVEFVESTEVLQLQNKRFTTHKLKAFINATVIENDTNTTISKGQFGGALETVPLKIVSKLSDTYRPGLPYYGQVKTVNHDGSARPNISVECSIDLNAYRFSGRRGSRYGSWSFTDTILSDENGIVNFGIPLFPEKPGVPPSVVLRFKAEVGPQTVYHSHTVYKVFSPSNTFLQNYPLDRMEPQRPCSSGKLIVRLQSNVVLHNKTLHVLTIARGNLQKVTSFPPPAALESQCEDQDDMAIGHYKCVTQEGKYKVRLFDF